MYTVYSVVETSFMPTLAPKYDLCSINKLLGSLMVAVILWTNAG